MNTTVGDGVRYGMERRPFAKNTDGSPFTGSGGVPHPAHNHIGANSSSGVSHNFTPPDISGSGQQIILDGDFLPANFRTQSYEIAKDTVRYVCRGECYGPAPSKAAVIMRSLVEDTIKDRSQMMAQLVKTLDVHEREQLQLVRNIANNMFDDEQVNWSRIVTLHAFCGCLAKYCEQRNLPDCADDVANVLADFVVNRLGLWVVTHGGWKGFESQFPALVLWGSSAVWKGVIIAMLLFFALVVFYSCIRFKEFERHFPALVFWGTSGLWKGLFIVVLLFGTMFAFYSSMQFYSGGGGT